ncbi:DMSO reductase [Lysobacter helvus]|uniref:DMSO reductase n=2 Tax=Lysobacteraceae TaxID=32033 RepID=A0ABN6FR11_9GAMM|nr:MULTISPECIES: DmsC/YnfH family molybdoenzyme membrane anchor subunit [Lysobacter]BCT92075.1 DMSO reductase [Lysobacter caseinilyticus]BCT95228.1 DMSO reductase [Lysobacter helvus]
MHPALSVIFFTTLSGAGYGLLFWAAWHALTGVSSARTLLVSIAVSIVLSTIGLLSSTLHLGKPMRAWRAFSQWRTSWLSREGVAAMLTFGIALLLGAAALPGMLDANATGSAVQLGIAGMGVAALSIIAALVTVYCTAMIYASLKPIPAWGHRLVPRVYVLFALFTGGLLFCAIATLLGREVRNVAALVAIVAALLLWDQKRRYWRDIDAPLPATRGDAIGLPNRTATVFERPHTEANYLTKEMGFVVARKHAKTLRRLAIVLFAVLPILALLPVFVFVHLDTAPWYTAAALSALAGAFVERWLFFAEAKHMVTLYY